MATAKEKSDLEELREDVSHLKTDVAVLQQFNEKVVEPKLDIISRKLDGLSFYTKSEIDVKLSLIQNKRWQENTVSAVFGSLLTAVVLYIIESVLRGNHYE